MPLDLYAEALVVVQGLHDFIENRERDFLKDGLVPGEVELFLQFELVPLNDNLLVGRAPPVVHRASRVGTAIDVVRNSVVVTVRTVKGFRVDGSGFSGITDGASTLHTDTDFKA